MGNNDNSNKWPGGQCSWLVALGFSSWTGLYASRVCVFYLCSFLFPLQSIVWVKNEPEEAPGIDQRGCIAAIIDGHSYYGRKRENTILLVCSK